MSSEIYRNRATDRVYPIDPHGSAMERLLQDMYPPGITVEFIPFDEVINLDDTPLPEDFNDLCEGRR